MTALPADLIPTTLPKDAKELVATVRSIRWSNWGSAESDAGNGAVIIELTDGQNAKGPAQDGEIDVGMAYRFLGKWVTHPKYGDQFQFTTFVPSTPSSRAGIIKYLIKLAPGVGEAKAKKLYSAFGADAVTICRENPQRVSDSGILNADQAIEVSAELTKHAALEQTTIELYELLNGRGFHGVLNNQLIRKWGAAAPSNIRKNPFRLLVEGFRSCGFRRVDRLYLDLGGNRLRTKRLMLAAWNSLREDSNGDTWRPFGIAREAIKRASGDSSGFAPTFDVQRPIKMGIRAKYLSVFTDASGSQWLGEAEKASNERIVAESIRRLLNAQPLWGDAATEEFAGMCSPHQRERLSIALTKPVAILGGTPGTGKTYTAAQVVKYLACQFGLEEIAVCAPTGKAAVRITEAMLRYGLDLNATTIHRFLGIGRNGHDGRGWGFQRNICNPVPFRFVVIDEVSMLDTDLAAALFSACQVGTHLLLVGDTAQLPPVGHGAPLRDLIAAGVPYGELEEIRRNSGLIVESCARIKQGCVPEFVDVFDLPNGKNLRHVEIEKPTEQLEGLCRILDKIVSKGERDPIWDVQVLVAVNDRSKSKVSRREVNELLQGKLNPDGQSSPGNPFRVGDKVICLRNSTLPIANLGQCPYCFGPPESNGCDECKRVVRTEPKNWKPSSLLTEFVANGEVGKVIGVGAGAAVVKFPLPDRVFKIPVKGKGKAKDEDSQESDGDENSAPSTDGAGADAGDFDLAYGLTTHKSQGSEWPIIIVLVDPSPAAKRICCREHIYTAISRAKDWCMTIGRREVIEQQCRRVSLTKRKTFLKELLSQ